MSSEASLSDLVEKFEELTRDETKASLDRALTTLKSTLRSLPSTSHDDSATLKHLASLVWNKCVEWKTKGLALDDLNVRFRHFACDCLSIAATEEPGNLKVQQELLNMYLRTGKLWSELKRFEMSDKCWSNATECFETISNSMQELLEEDLQAFRIAAFSLWSWVLEEKITKTSRVQLDHNTLSTLAKKASGFVTNESQQSYLAGQCSIVAGKLMNEKDYPKAIEWLEESLRLFDSIKDEASSKERKANMAQVLRSISTCKDALGEIDQAVRAIEMAYTNSPNDSKTLEHYAKLAIKLHRFERAREMLSERFRMTGGDPKDEIAFAQNNLVGSKDLFDTATEILEGLMDRHRGSDYGDRSLMLYMEHLSLNDLPVAVERLGQLLAGPLQNSFKNETIEFVCGNILQRATEAADTKPADLLTLVESLAQILPKNLKDSQAKTLRLLSRIQLQLQNYQQSLRHALDSRLIEPTSQKSLLLLFLNYLNLSMEKEALEALTELMATESPNLSQVTMICTEQAIKAKKPSIASRCMEFLLSRSLQSDSTSHYPEGYIGSLVISLIKLAQHSSDKHEVLSFVILDKALLIINNRSSMRIFEKLEGFLALPEPTQYFTDPLNEILWISHIAWNQALDFKDKGDFGTAITLFKACNAWTKLLPDSASSLDTRVKCIYQLVDFISKSPNALENAKETFEKITECRVLLKKLQGHQDRVDQRFPLAPVEDYPSLQKEIHKEDGIIQVDLLRTEFFLACRLPKGGIDLLAEQISILPVTEEEKINLFIDFAQEGVKASRLHSTFSIKYLRHAMTLSLKLRDFALWATANRVLISILPDKESTAENFHATVQLLKAIDTRQFPEMELQYLITTAYNNGVYYAHLSRYKDAARWMEMSMNLLPFSQYKSTYESDILEGYNRILAKLDPEVVAGEAMVQ